MSTIRLTGQLVASADAPCKPTELIIEGTRIAAILPPETDLPPEAPWIVPGLIDAHVHPLETGLALLFPDLGGCTSLAQVFELIADNLSRVGDCPVALAFNLEPDALVERRYPRRTELDALSPKRPLLVYRVDGHSAATNTAGLNLLSSQGLNGIDLGPDHKPTGVLRGQIYETVSLEFKRRLPPDVIREAIALAGRHMAARGVTAIGALVGSDELSIAEWSVLVDSLAALPIRAIPYLQSWNPEVAHGFGLSQTGGCLLLDGSFGSRTAALSTPYADAPGESGLLYRSDEQVASYIVRASGLRLQTAFHAIGDRAVEQLVRCHESVGPQPEALRHRIEHAELIRPELVERVKQLGLSLVVQPAFEALWGGPERLYSSRLGDRWRATNPLRSLRSAGIPLAGSSDSPVTPADPLAGIRAAMSLPNAAQCLTGEEALALFTSAAASALRIDRETGAIAPGMSADFVVLDRDPRTDPGCRLLATWHAGSCIHRT